MEGQPRRRPTYTHVISRAKSFLCFWVVQKRGQGSVKVDSQDDDDDDDVVVVVDARQRQVK